MLLIEIRHAGDGEEKEHAGIAQIASNIVSFIPCDKALSAGLFSSLPIKSA